MEKLVPKLRFPEFLENWISKRVGDHTYSSAFGPRFSSDLYSIDGNIVTLRTTDMDLDGKIDYKDAPRAQLDIEKFEDHLLSEGDLVISRSGTIGITGVFEQYLLPVIPGAFLIRFRLDTGVLNPKFIQLLFNSGKGRKKIESLAAGGVQKNLTGTSILNLHIVVPSLPEQTKIAEFLTAIDKRIELLTAKKEKLTLYKKGVMQKIFNQEIRFKPDEGGAFPEWTSCYAGDLFASVTNKNHNSDLPILAITQEHGAIPRNLIDYNISVSEKSVDSYKVVEKGDFIISLRSFQGGIEYSNYLGICSPAYIILKPKVEIVDQWFKYFFKTDRYIVQLNEKLEGIRDGKMISYKYFSETKINLPSLAEQAIISKFFLSIDDQIQKVEEQITLNQTYKKGLLQHMFV